MTDLPNSIEDALTCAAEAVAALRKLLREQPSAGVAKELSMASKRFADLLEQHRLAKRVEALESQDEEDRT